MHVITTAAYSHRSICDIQELGCHAHHVASIEVRMCLNKSKLSALSRAGRGCLKVCSLGSAGVAALHRCSCLGTDCHRGAAGSPSVLCCNQRVHTHMHTYARRLSSWQRSLMAPSCTSTRMPTMRTAVTPTSKMMACSLATAPGPKRRTTARSMAGMASTRELRSRRRQERATATATAAAATALTVPPTMAAMQHTVSRRLQSPSPQLLHQQLHRRLRLSRLTHACGPRSP